MLYMQTMQAGIEHVSWIECIHIHAINEIVQEKNSIRRACRVLNILTTCQVALARNLVLPIKASQEKATRHDISHSY